MQLFHGHIYFTADQIELAGKVRDNLASALPQLTYIGKLIPKPIGPHSKPMFEIHIPAAEIDPILAVIDNLREGLPVLIHPVLEDELAAHTALARWLGEVLPLDLKVLEKPRD
ncbi:MAG: DOPA 4,5-dioxygenase family protein [Nitrosomonas sp.]|uniref:DOPA 4,5-dioxygenase family protein n=1 Tax=Nitrosomonas sp. TaxID=42353 RepID=UPI001D234DFD|nr:DOPA 4,5-dioxygenase family protein [Nitrosomonas sp.]MBX9895027.1 DOPA 4,5-dioxygenase family protein [Nitrosomonas sp.]